jgi:hypothetical protein
LTEPEQVRRFYRLVLPCAALRALEIERLVLDVGE